MPYTFMHILSAEGERSYRPGITQKDRDAVIARLEFSGQVGTEKFLRLMELAEKTVDESNAKAIYDQSYPGDDDWMKLTNKQKATWFTADAYFWTDEDTDSEQDT